MVSNSLDVVKAVNSLNSSEKFSLLSNYECDVNAVKLIF